VVSQDELLKTEF